ncbi:hypothetical protein NCS57_01163400 [Fusarium keratoplasticum]|uniref:Uncharacterized protein n=1 Tax=Fusarium keratoplasticum TaxID=1328300 RepID=A0ACC0QNN5_9HYPO|nr:hypothetical protein NCS57_01163400 [Fusarium keratoplasticum]KAI8657840.1 hypothetical protein NCS57_01163400 [Fusarium keratoplasticum]
MIELALVSYILRGDGIGRRIFSTARKFGGSLFGLTSKHQVLVHLPGVDRLMEQSLHALSAEPVQYALLTRVYGGVGSPALKKKLENSWRDFLPSMERRFLNESGATATIERTQRWEVSADVRAISTDLQNSPAVVEANLHSLVRDFGACIAIPILYGNDFLDRNPRLLDDLWKFDSDLFIPLLLGVPTWAPFQVIKDGLGARSRLLSAMESLYRCIDQYQRGGLIDTEFDLSDVKRAAGDFSILWGQNANLQPMLAWFTTFVYATPGLVKRIREETAAYITLSTTTPLEIISMDIPGLCRSCQLLKACIFETYRIANDPAVIRRVERSITIQDGELQHQLQAGSFISMPTSLANSDPAIFENPDKFIPERFIERNSTTGSTTARYGTLRPWGMGSSMCKGRTFAQKHMTVVGAAIISLWDIEPASGTWEIPVMIPGSSAKRPAEDIRVVIKRRVL